MSIARLAPRPPLQILVTPIAAHNEYAGSEGRAAAAIFVSDPNRSRQPDQRLLQALYGLTRAESRVAAVVAEGLPVDAAAHRLGLTLGTTRWYIKQLRAKTGTSTHAQLTRALVGGLSAIK
jgi:DNA-binding CsgD family transcriptional regulator